jgi:hypothetical protein
MATDGTDHCESPITPIQHLPTPTFGPLKDALTGRRFADDELKHSVREELLHFGKEFPAFGIPRLTQIYKTYVDKGGDFVGKNLNFVKNYQ